MALAPYLPDVFLYKRNLMMRLSFSVCFTVVLFSFMANPLRAQSRYMLYVPQENTVLNFTAVRGATSQPDTIRLETERYGGRYRIFFDGAGSKFFRVIEPQDKWIKMKKHETVKLLVVFSPPASFEGEIFADVWINALAGNRAKVHLKGISTD